MPEQITPIDVAYPDGAERLSVRVSVGACKLDIGRSETGWVTGSYRDPGGKIPISVERNGGALRIRQRPDVESIVGIFEGAPSLRLGFGSDRPFDLVVEGGANEFELDLGGIPITGLEIRHGAGQVDLSFDQPNPAEMERLRIAMGAGALEASGLGNANFGELVAEGGAARYQLGFEGELRRPGKVRASTGAAGVELRVPATTAAKIRARTTLGSTEVGGGFVTRDGEYWTEAADAGASPVVEMDVTVAVGIFRLLTIG